MCWSYSSWWVLNVLMLSCFSFHCRIKFYTQEIVFFRHDLLYRMRRSCLMPPSTEETDDPFEHVFFSPTSQPCLFQTSCWYYVLRIFINETNKLCLFLWQLVATITHQSHLCPLPLIVQPIIWNYDHCLHLYPSPHTVCSCLFNFFFVVSLYHSLTLFCTLGNAIIFPSFDLVWSMELCMLQYIW